MGVKFLFPTGKIISVDQGGNSASAILEIESSSVDGCLNAGPRGLKENTSRTHF